jgi:hypothetical protein
MRPSRLDELLPQFDVEEAHTRRVAASPAAALEAVHGASRRRFGRYWRVIRPGSGAIRWSWLRAAARRAEAA